MGLGPATGASTAAGIIANDTGTGFGFNTQQSFIAEAGTHEPNASSCKEYAYAEHKNQRYRPQMEDSKSFESI